jgi:hypothetical protein
MAGRLTTQQMACLTICAGTTACSYARSRDIAEWVRREAEALR